MSITDEAINAVKKDNYPKSVLLRRKFDSLQEELYGKPIK